MPLPNSLTKYREQSSLLAIWRIPTDRMKTLQSATVLHRGRFKDRTRPSPGNHEYRSDAASGYAHYFGSQAGDPTKGYYSYDLGAWHIVSLNSECEQVGGCGASSPQGRWLTEDLAQHPAGCTLAYFHKPLFSSGGAHGNDPTMKVLWDILYHGGADIIVNGHDHDYERFAPQDPQGT